jgi:hypothetical protein
MLFHAFPTGADLTSETTLKAYVTAIDGCSLAGLTEAVRRFVRGEVEDHNGKFAPSTAQLARVVRQEDQAIEIRRRFAGRQQIERPQPENVVVLSDEERQRRYQQFRLLAGKIQGMGEK